LHRSGTTIVKIPINEYEYLLVENRQAMPTNHGMNLKADPYTGVILGLLDSETSRFTGAYDFLLPGSGLLIWKVNERIAYMDYVGNGKNNFLNNTLQMIHNLL
jgi:hypothetical protein